jgi:hypothetical protein
MRLVLEAEVAGARDYLLPLLFYWSRLIMLPRQAALQPDVSPGHRSIL